MALDKDYKYPYTKDSTISRQLSEIATKADVEEQQIVPQTVADSTAVDVAGIVADHNALLAALRTAGVLTS